MTGGCLKGGGREIRIVIADYKQEKAYLLFLDSIDLEVVIVEGLC